MYLSMLVCLPDVIIAHALIVRRTTHAYCTLRSKKAVNVDFKEAYIYFSAVLNLHTLVNFILICRTGYD